MHFTQSDDKSLFSREILLLIDIDVFILERKAVFLGTREMV